MARFHDEALPRFFAGTYAGAYMAERVARFDALLPTAPPWIESGEAGGRVGETLAAPRDDFD